MFDDLWWFLPLPLPTVPEPPEPQVLALPSIDLADAVGRPRIVNSADSNAGLSVDVVTFPTGSPVTLGDSWDRSFEDPVGDVGSGSMTIDADDANVAAGDLVRFWIDGEIVFAWFVASDEWVRVSDGDDAARVRKLSGPGAGSAMSRSVVYPSLGLGRTPIEADRWFDWTAVDFDDSGWSQNGDAMVVDRDTWVSTWSSHLGERLPPADVVWAPVGTVWWAPVGHCYFRWRVDTAFLAPNPAADLTGWDHRTFGVALWGDNFAQLYIDGQPTLQGGIAGGMATGQVTLDAGVHTFAVHGNNSPPAMDLGVDPATLALLSHTVVDGETLRDIAGAVYGDPNTWSPIYDANAVTIRADAVSHGDWDPARPWAHLYAGQVLALPGTSRGGSAGDPRGNPAGVSWLMWADAPNRPTDPADASAALFNVATTTDPSFRYLAYPSVTPGMAPGAILTNLSREANSRGTSRWLVQHFGSRFDSAGKAWIDAHGISTKVGSSLETFLGELGATHVDWQVAPTGRDLYLWPFQGRGRHTGVTLTVTSDPATSEVAGLSGTTTAGQQTTVMLVSSGAGWTETRSADVVERIEATLGLGALRDPSEIANVAKMQLATYANARQELRVEVLPTDSGVRPYREYRPGDWVTIDADDVAGEYRIVSIAVDESDERPRFVLTLNDRIALALERLANTLQKMDNGTVGGDSRVAQPLWPGFVQSTKTIYIAASHD